MERFARFFLYAFLADGILSVADEGLGHDAFGGTLNLARMVAALGVMVWAVFLYGGMVLSPRFCKRILLPPVLFTFWAGFLAALPLPLFFGEKCILYVALAQTALGLGIIFGFGRRGETGWSLPVTRKDRAAFSLGNLGLGVLISAALGGVAALILGVSVTRALDQGTAGYIRLRPSGIYFEERCFQRGDREVCLVGMVHIAQESFYNDLAKDLHSRQEAIILLEGITDQENHLGGKFSYERVAEWLGFSAQESSAFSHAFRDAMKKADHAGTTAASLPLKYRRADLDVSNFQPETIALIKAVGELLQSRTVQEALARLSDPNSALANEDGLPIVIADVLDGRNKHLLGEIQSALRSHQTVIVPWGAAHMPGLQKKLEEWGFRETRRSSRLAVAFFQPPE